MRAQRTATAALAELARAYGVQASYRDAMGLRRRGGQDAVVAALRALGAPLDDAGQAPAALAEHAAAQAARLAEPVVVAWDGAAAHLGADAQAGPLECTLVREDGTEQPFRADAATAAAPADLPAGYHRLHVAAGDGRAAEVLVVAAPARAPAAPRALGAFLPLYALPVEAGLADLGDLEALVAAAGARGVALVGTTPLYAAFLDEPFDPSPYAPASRLFWNELYVDLERLPELAATPAAQAALPALAAGVDADGLADYRGAEAARRVVLDALAATAFTGQGVRRETLESHVAQRPQLAAYADFRAARDPDPAAARRRHLYAQWVADDQLAAVARAGDAAGAGLYLDLPLGVHPQAFDIAAEPDSFALGVGAGAPPDVLQPAGQAWGLPPLHPLGMRTTHHRYTIACLRAAFRHARALRVDHVAGLHRLFWVPDGCAAADGVYVRYPAEELYAILLVEAARRGAAVIGEDLGTIPRAVRATLRRHGILRSWVLQFAMPPDDDGPAPVPPADSLAALDTHDVPPFAAWWHGGARAAAAPAEVRRRLTELARGPARIVLANLEDLWGETASQNVPGTAGGGNWRRRARHGGERLDDLAPIAEARG